MRALSPHPPAAWYVSPVAPEFGKFPRAVRVIVTAMGDSRTAALALLAAPPGAWVSFGEFDTYAAAGSSPATSKLLAVLSHARNLRRHVTIEAKTPATCSAFIRANVDWVAWQPWPDARANSWLIGCGLVAEPLAGEHDFYLSDFSDTVTIRGAPPGAPPAYDLSPAFKIFSKFS